MRIWLITVGEPLPTKLNTDRLWRIGLLSEELCSRGHEVIWWTSRVDHIRKKYFVQSESRVKVNDNLSIYFLSGRLYKKNISINRLLNHREIGICFSLLARTEIKPDVILCSFPTIELSREAVKYGLEFEVPVILDVRDLWPDIFIRTIPSWLKLLSRFVLIKYFNDTKWAFENCHSIIGISEGYLKWGGLKGSRLIDFKKDKIFPLAYKRGEWSDSDRCALISRFQACCLDFEKPTACFVGTFGRTYNLKTVINAALLLAKRQDWHGQIVLCGTGEGEDECRMLSMGIPGIGLIGWLSAGELSCMLANSKIAIAAYASGAPQGIPNKIVEYLSAGLPIISSLEGESRILLENNSCVIYYNPTDQNYLADSLCNLMNNSLLRELMSKSSMVTFENLFSASAIYGAFASHLEKAAI